jgi:hypothetical protein
LVRPNQGLIAPNGTEIISILLVEKDKQVLLQSFDRLGQSALDHSKDKFLVQSCTVSQEFAKKYNEEKIKANTLTLQKELSDALTSMWNAIASGGSTTIFNKKLHVKHLATENSNAAAEPVRTPSLAAIEALSPEQLFTELSALRRKYDELVSFSVNLTAERDILNNTLEQTKRDLNREMSSRAALENSNPKGTGVRSGAGAANATKKSSLVLVPFLVVSILAFLAGVKLTMDHRVGFLRSVPLVGSYVMGPSVGLVIVEGGDGDVNDHDVDQPDL